MSSGLLASLDPKAEFGSDRTLYQFSIDHILREVRTHLSLNFHRFVMPRKEPEMSTASENAGQAALSIFEALLLAMNDRRLQLEDEIVGVLRDAAVTH
jgi:hypothetical protein